MTAPTETGKSGAMTGGEKCARIAAILAIIASAYTLLAAEGVGDKAWLLLAARKWLSGGRLYVDIFEINPPLIIYIDAIPAWISLHLRAFGDYTLLTLLGIACSLLSAWLCTRLLRSHPAFVENERGQGAFFLLLLAVFVASAGPPVFFDREHIFLVLTFPYLLRFMPSLAGTKLGVGRAMLVGFMAGIGFCIKPYCVIVFAAVQLLYYLRTRKADILYAVENLALYAVACAYLASLYLYTPEYLSVVLPMALATYASAGLQVNGLFFGAVVLTMLGAVFADFRWRAASPFRPDVWYLLALSPAFLLYALANNGWGYTYGPLISIVLVLTGWVRMEYLWFMLDAAARGLSGKPFLLGARACAVALSFYIGCSAAGGLYTVTTGCRQHLNCTRWGREIVTSMNGLHSFGAMSGDFDIWTHLNDMTGARWDTRFNHLWMLPKFFLTGPEFAERNRWILQYVAEGLAQDMDEHKPDVMFVDNTDVFFHTVMHADLVAYFSVFPKFAKAWQHYRHEQSIHSCSHPEKAHCNFEVFRRIP